jgi:hypothetical protein
MPSKRAYDVRARVFTQAWKTITTFLQGCTKKELSALRGNSDYMVGKFLLRLRDGVNTSHHAVRSASLFTYHASKHYVTLLSTKTGQHEYVIDFGFRKFDKKSPWPLVESIDDYRARVRAL